MKYSVVTNKLEDNVAVNNGINCINKLEKL